jgi:hypothetical protein
MANGERMPGVTPNSVVPAGVRLNLIDSSAFQGSGPGGAGLPKAIVDEVETYAAGLIGRRGNFFAEQYIVNGGMPGLTRDAWLQERLNPWEAKIPLSITVGQMPLSVPVDPETFRESYQHYTLYDQMVATNPFNFYEDKIGARFSAGDMLHGTNVQFFTGPGHDVQSGLSSYGMDLMGYAQQTMGPATVSAYRYWGARPDNLRPRISLTDNFQRTGFGLVIGAGKWTSESNIQTGWDSSVNAGSGGAASSGGFTQLRYAFNRRLFALGRYEGTNDTVNGMARDGVLLLGFGPTHNSRLTIEDVIQHTPQTHNTMNAQLTVAY